jgi:hypothetical protein
VISYCVLLVRYFSLTMFCGWWVLRICRILLYMVTTTDNLINCFLFSWSTWHVLLRSSLKFDCSFKFAKWLIGSQLSKASYYVYCVRWDYYTAHVPTILMTFQSIENWSVCIYSLRLEYLSTNKILCQWRFEQYPVTREQRLSYRNLKLTTHPSNTLTPIRPRHSSSG